MELGQCKDSLINAIRHYQDGIDRYVKRKDEARILHCITKLQRMPITVQHLEETGVGRTINGLRKFSGNVGPQAKNLVSKWKDMVMEEGEDSPNSNYETVNNQNNQSYAPTEESSNVSDSHDDGDENILSIADLQNLQKEEDYDNVSVEKNKINYSEVRKDEKHKSRSEKSDSYENEKRKSCDHKSKYRDDHNSDDSCDRKAKRHKSSHKEDSNKIHKKNRKTESHDHSSSKRKESSSSDKQREKKHKNYDKSYRSEELSKSGSSKSSKSRDFSSDEENSDETKYSSNKNENKSSKSMKRKHEDEEYSKKKHHKHKRVDKSESNHSTEESHSSKHEEKRYTEKNKHDRSSDKSKPKNSDKIKEQDKPSKNKKNSEPNGSSSSIKQFGENGIGSESGTSFADALGMCFPSSSKTNKKKALPKRSLSPNISSPEDQNEFNIPKSSIKLEALDINLASSSLPEIKPNYRPMGSVCANNQSKSKLVNSDAALMAVLNTTKTRTKVYSGNKVTSSEVPSLFDFCIRVLKENIDALEYTGGVPYDLLKPVIERATPDQLFVLEHHNPYLIEDTDELWQLFCQKEFRNKKRDELETWREMYMRCLDEREAKLKALTTNIKINRDKSLPVRQTKLAFVENITKPPKSMIRKTAKHGMATNAGKKPLITPSDRLASIAANSGQVSVPNPVNIKTGNPSTSIKPKKAPLMQKSLALLRNRHFKR